MKGSKEKSRLGNRTGLYQTGAQAILDFTSSVFYLTKSSILKVQGGATDFAK